MSKQHCSMLQSRILLRTNFASFRQSRTNQTCSILATMSNGRARMLPSRQLQCGQLVDNRTDDADLLDELSSRSLEQHRQRVKALEDKYRWKLNEHGLPGRILTESGKPGDVIINTAIQEKAGMIVLGSRGLGRLKRTFTSTSVSDYVLHRAKCPVVICRAASDVTAPAVAGCSNNL